METDLPWFGDLSAEDRSWIGLIVQAGIRGSSTGSTTRSRRRRHDPLAAVVFGTAPRELTGVITLQQTVELVRPTIGSSRATSTTLVDPEDAPEVARGGAALRPRGRLRHRRGLRPGRRVARRLGRPARGAGRRLGAARRGRRERAVPRERAGLGGARRRGRGARRHASPPGRAPTSSTSVRRSARAGGWTRCAPCRATGSSSCSAASTTRARPRAGSLDHFGDGPVVVGPVVADLPAPTRPPAPRSPASRRQRLARRPAPGREPRPAPRAGARRRRPRAAPARRRGLPAARRRPAAPARDPGGVPRARRRRSRATGRALFVHPNTVRYRLRADRRRSPACHPTDARATPFTLQLALILGRQSAAHTESCRNPTKISGSISCGVGPARDRPRPGRVDLCSSSSLPDKAPRPPASSRPGSRTRPSPTRLDWLSAVAGLDLAHYGTEADAETIRDTAVAQPLLVASGLVAALELFPHPADAFAQIGAVAGHSVGEITAAAGAGVITAEQAMVLVRERGKAMAEAAAATADRHDRRPRRRPRRGARRARARTASPPPTTTAPARSSPPAPSSSCGARRRPAGQGPADAAERRRRVPHRAHGARGRRPRRRWPGRSRPTTRAPG